MTKRLTDHKVLTFDCYGTLIDWEGGVWDHAQAAILENRRDDITRDRLLSAFSIAESDQQAATPGMNYQELSAIVHQKMADQFGLTTSAALNKRFGAKVGDWPAFADTADALRRLKKHFKLAILSNIDNASFAEANKKLGVEFDAIYTAEDIGSYKPTQRNFDYMFERLKADHGLEKADILHTAQSLFHDHVAAKANGLANVWIDRQRLSEGGKWGATREIAERPETDWIFFTLAEMADAVEAEARGA